MYIELQLKNSLSKIACNTHFEFHIARDIRKKYEIDDTFFSLNGNVVFADFGAVRNFVNKINAKRYVAERVTYGHINAVGLLDEIYHFMLREYEQNVNPKVFNRAVEFLNEKIGEEQLRKLLFEFTDLFPPEAVFKNGIPIFNYLNSFEGSKSNVESTIEEILLLYFSNINPANKKIKELFDDSYLKTKEVYDSVIKELDIFFQAEPVFGAENQDIFTLFKTPIFSAPDNLWDQLEFIRIKWGVLLKDKFNLRILSSKDLMKEDVKFEQFSGPAGLPPSVAPVYKGKIEEAEKLVIGKSFHNYAKDSETDYDEPEKFTADIHWMPKVVLMAKNVYVWLDQLSKKYERNIRTLDQIPDIELDQLAAWNFTGLWLIGLWERSSASKAIKHIMGNIDAVASAYSLYDYKVAADLGGDAAYNDLNARARKRGIRLASDMVPNHSGIYSDWVINHPDYFVQSKNPPFPNYNFTGHNLSEHPDVEVRIEDGYYTRSDASVVFQRIDKRYGDVRYIYHGNDGTNMPWNDTAQLDMLKKEVREAVINKIFDVARKFSIIRFDAAMTLTKRHFSRLWYPQPGKGGDIPSRADHTMTKEQFDEVFPEEFWREVVDRINSEMPDTLLLAEAFWLMEGYFVRSLGMHRVYNSAFMHMMMKEENDKYRDLITNTLEFEPEILKRYVNFMSNPDEETAIKQFGTDDKYFGVLTLMVTLPGLPMFAHGQIEGYTEKYGMEYQRAYYTETEKTWLVERHQREIFPLTKKRYLFAEIENFWFYDCIDEYGNINENIFAYTNIHGNEKSLVIYNNKYENAYGRINVTTPKLVSNSTGEKISKSLTFMEALSLRTNSHFYYICRDSITGMEYLLKGSDLANGGYYVHLEGFKYKVLLGFYEIYDETGRYEDLYISLHGNPVKSVNYAVEDMKLAQVHEAFENMFRTKDLEKLVDCLITDVDEEQDTSTELNYIFNKFGVLVNEIKKINKTETEETVVIKDFSAALLKIKNINLSLVLNFSPATHNEMTKLNRSIVISEEANYKENFLMLYTFIIINEIYNLVQTTKKTNKLTIIDQLHLSPSIEKILQRLGRGSIGVEREMVLLKILLLYGDKFVDKNKPESRLIDVKTKTDVIKFIAEIKRDLVETLLGDDYVKFFIMVNEYKEIVYYSKERLEELVDWVLSISLLKYLVSVEKIEKVIGEKKSEVTVESNNEVPEANSLNDEEELKQFISKMNMVGLYIKSCSDSAGYQLEKLKKLLLEG